ncbi:MAG: IS4 family transposase [Candidatus Brocadiia bacterium]
MTHIDTELAELERSLEDFSVEALAAHLKGAWIKEVLATTGRASVRVRKLPARFVVWLVIGMALFRRLSIQNVLLRVGKPLGGSDLWSKEPSSAAVTKARDRLGVAPLPLLADRLAESLHDRFGRALCWRGMELVTIDGSTFKMPDSRANSAYFGRQEVARGRTAYPQMRAVFLSSATHHFIWAARFAPYHTGEVPLAMELIEEVRTGSLVLLDRNFLAYKLLARLLERRSDFIVRMKKNTKARRIHRFAEGDYLVRVTPPWSVRKDHPNIPEHLLLREVVADTGGEEPLRLLTSLVDASAVSKADLVDLDLDRWEVETALDEVKTHQVEATTITRPTTFRSKAPDRVLQEAHGLVIAYNLARALMAEGAERADLPPRRISFVDALARIREAIPRMASAPARQLPRLHDQLLEEIRLCVLPPRRPRSNPRAVRIKMSSYPVKRPEAVP